jgi:hypothetical protein
VRHFVEPEAAAIFRRFKESGALEELDVLLRLLLPVVEAAVCTKLGRFPADYDELQSYVLRKLCRGLARNYDPERGSLFNFTVKTVENACIDLLRRKAARDRHLTPFTVEMAETFGVNGVEHRHAVADVAFRVMKVKTTLRDPGEEAAARWLVRNLLSSGFRFYRFEAANSMAIVYSIRPDRARRIFDITLLSVRRALVAERRLKPIDPATLRCHKSAPLLRYRAALSEEEFARLCYLMRNLAPSVIDDSSLRDVLYGPANERPLFSHAEALAAAAAAVSGVL